MKKLLPILSILFSFNSFGDWVGFVMDANENVHYVDFDQMEKTDGYVYYWEMVNYTKPTDRLLSIATYHMADCDLYRYKNITFNGYTQEMGQGEPETMDLTLLNEGWINPVAGSVGDYSLALACQAEL
jgi:hypothetical protein